MLSHSSVLYEHDYGGGAPSSQVAISCLGKVSASATLPIRMPPESITFKIASTRTEREAAFRLVYEAYTRRGLMDPNPWEMRVTDQHLLPTTNIYNAVHRGQVIYTMTLISDDVLRLPLECIYEEEIDQLRKQGVYMAEVSCLASRENYFEGGRMFEVFVDLVSLMFQSARANGIDRLVIAVHPRHARFYQRLLGFRQFGELKTYASVCDHPAVALEHNFARLDRERYRLYDRIYNTTYTRWELLDQPMSADEREYFRPATLACGPCLPVATA